MKRIAPSLLALTLLAAAEAGARTLPAPGADGWCGTRASTPAIAWARHQDYQRRRALLRPDRLAVGEAGIQQGPTVKKQKNVAVIEDDGSIFQPPSLFDLGNRVGVQFKRGGPATRIERFPERPSGERGDRIEIGDDASRTIDLPFPFTFYGKVHRRVFLNSDGNLTFERADSASTERSVSRFLEGPPRIAVDFLDLDPSVTSGAAGVYLLVRAGLVRVTWLDVPEFGAANSNTFQVTLYPNGRITMAYEDVDAETGIVGVSPGGPGLITLLDLSGPLPRKATPDAIAEHFRDVEAIDDMEAAKAAFSAVRDEYDVLVLFADFPVDLDGAFAYNAAVQNEIRGIGDGIYDFSSLYGSERLKAFVQMGSLANYPGRPNAFIGSSEATGIGILAHEVGHRWLAFVRFITAQGQRSTDLLGRQLGHWSFLLDSDGSVMEGNDIRDNGDGTFTTVGSWRGFSPLDEYLMGLRRPDQVPPFFYVTGSILDPEGAPSTNVIIQGQRVDVDVDQIIAAEGPRVPAMTEKPTQVFFVLLGRQGEPPGLESIKKVNQYRNRLASFVRQQTDGRGRIATFLRLKPAAAAAGLATPEPAAAVAAPAPEGEAALAAPPEVSRELDRRFDRIAGDGRR